MKSINRKETREEAAYLLEYEKQKLQICARSFEDLASLFIYIPGRNITESSSESLLMDQEPNLKLQSRQEVMWKRRLMENRELLADNLREMAYIMEQVAGERVHAIPFPGRKKKQLIHLLEDEGLIIRDIYMLEGNGEKAKIAVSARVKKGMNMTSAQLAEYLSILLNRHLKACIRSPFFISQEHQMLYFEEDVHFTVLTGYAKAIKEDEKISGDNHSFFETASGIFTALLSDGMGSGEKACADSETVIDMAEKLMDAGFSMEMTVQMINDALLAGAEESNMSTLDVCSVNLHDATASFVKIGSAATYIKSGTSVEKIPSVSLPLGMFHKLSVIPRQVELQSGDYIIMLSDGIADCLTGSFEDEFTRELIAGMEYEHPNEIANCLMKYVLSISKGRIRDDMTVLVMGFWENKYED